LRCKVTVPPSKPTYSAYGLDKWRLWSANEVKLLKKLYPSENTQSIADKLGRSYEVVSQKANLIGLKKAGIAPVCVWSRQKENEKEKRKEPKDVNIYFVKG